MSPKLTSKKRLELIKRALSGEPISDICEENKISRVIFYKWIKRFKENGEEGLKPYKREYKKSKKTSVKSIKQHPSLDVAARLRMVCEVIKENTPLRIVAERNKVSKVTLYKWIKRYQQAGESKQALRPKTRAVERYFRQTPEVYETALLNLIVQHPEYGIRRLVVNLPKIGRRPVIGHHGVQNTLKRHQLLSFEERLRYSQSQRTAIVRLIENVLEPVRSFFVIPAELRHQAIRFGLTAFLSTGATIAVIGLIGLTGRSWLAVSGVNRIGLGFALTALLMGSVFFLYSLKYYLTVAIVLSYSQREGETGTNSREQARFKASHWLTWLLGALGGNGNGNNKNGQKGPVGLEPDLGKIELERHPKIAIHIPFYNEKKVVERAIEAAISLHYPNYEVVLVDDSTDETTDIIRKIQTEFLGKGEALETTNGKGYTLTEVEVKQGVVLKHIHRTSRAGFKGGALGLALKLTDRSVEFISVFDADFVPYPDTLELFLKYFKAQNEMKEDYAHSNVAAVQGYQWHVLNKSENWITRGVRSEYSGSYVIERSGIEIYGGLKQISGSVYMIRREVLQQVGWGESITEDFELTLRLYAQGYRVVYTPYIQAPAECVSTLRRLIRQRMRWAEGHSQNIRHMFKKLITNPRLTTTEKLEFVYLSPYYLQAGFFLIGTLCWLISETVFPARLPFWTSLWGWSLVLTNLLALPLMNAVGLFLEESEEKDYLGLASFVALSYILVPFQAYASVKGFLEQEEGPWFRTPKTGRITDIFTRGKFYRFIQGIIPGKQAVSFHLGGVQYLALATAHNQFNSFHIRPKRLRWVGKVTLAVLLVITVTVYHMAYKVSEVYATAYTGPLAIDSAASGNMNTSWQLKDNSWSTVNSNTKNTVAKNAASFQYIPGTTNTTAGTPSTTTPTGEGWIWDVNLGDGGSIADGNWTFNICTTDSDTDNKAGGYPQYLAWKVALTGTPDTMTITSSTNFFDSTTSCSATNLWTGGTNANRTCTFNPTGTTYSFDTTQKYLYVEIWDVINDANDDTTDNETFHAGNSSCTTDPQIAPPTVTVPEFVLVLIFVVPFIPLLLRRMLDYRKSYG